MSFGRPFGGVIDGSFYEPGLAFLMTWLDLSGVDLEVDPKSDMDIPCDSINASITSLYEANPPCYFNFSRLSIIICFF